MTVSIHARHYWRAMRWVPDDLGCDGIVSIHARHYWRAMPRAESTGDSATAFQSTPAITGGRCRPRALRVRRWPCFNPRPPLLAGDAMYLTTNPHADAVSIHARHYWRAMHARAVPLVRVSRVSIHARHYWRAMLQPLEADFDVCRVSIHARHYWRAMQTEILGFVGDVYVSIHARHYWRAMPFRRVRWRPATAVSIHARHYWRAMPVSSS